MAGRAGEIVSRDNECLNIFPGPRVRMKVTPAPVFFLSSFMAASTMPGEEDRRTARKSA